MSILIVEDSENALFVLKAMLNNAGHNRVETADSATKALDLLGINGGDVLNDEVELILMDLMMPDVDGIEAARKIKEQEAFKDTPILMITAHADVKFLAKAFEAGAMDYIIKPVDKVELVSRINSALRLKNEMDRRKEREGELMKLMEQLEDVNKSLKILSAEDGLTGIANRRTFEDLFDVEWRRALRDKKSISLVFIDIDHFKGFNDTYGHQAGDNCLVKVARRLADSINRPADLVARYGGEEFVVVLPDTDSKGAEFKAEELRKNVWELTMPHKKSSHKFVSISLGVASTIPTLNSKSATLLSAADRAVYEAKTGGRNKVVVSKIAR